MPFSFEVALLKGRKHYLCLHKFEYALQEEEKNYDMALTKAKILVWLLQTETGDRDELNIPEGGKLLWNRICSDAYSPGGMQSNWFSRCFTSERRIKLYLQISLLQIMRYYFKIFQVKNRCLLHANILFLMKLTILKKPRVEHWVNSSLVCIFNWLYLVLGH